MDQLERAALEIQKRLNKKERAAYKKILRQYKQITDEIMKELAALYEKTGNEEGKLTYAELNRFYELQRFERRVMAQVALLGKSNLDEIKKLLEESYDLSYSFMSFAIEKEAEVLLSGAVPSIANLLITSTNNPIYGLRMTDAQKRDQALTVRGINEAINDGIKAGDTYGGIAKRIRKVFDSSMKRSMTIARTETHRVKNIAEQDSSMNAHNQGVKMKKTWRNMDDEAVRETKKANHVEINGQTVMANENFTAKSGAVGPVPGSMGTASEDVNCRCFASRRIASIEPQVPKQAVKGTFEEWYEKKRA